MVLSVGVGNLSAMGSVGILLLTPLHFGNACSNVSSMSKETDKILEVRMRNTLQRRGYRLRKSRRRDPLAPDYGGHWIDCQNEQGGYFAVAGGEHGMSLDDVVRWVEEMK